MGGPLLSPRNGAERFRSQRPLGLTGGGAERVTRQLPPGINSGGSATPAAVTSRDPRALPLAAELRHAVSDPPARHSTPRLDRDTWTCTDQPRPVLTAAQGTCPTEACQALVLLRLAPHGCPCTPHSSVLFTPPLPHRCHRSPQSGCPQMCACAGLLRWYQLIHFFPPRWPEAALSC